MDSSDELDVFKEFSSPEAEPDAEEDENCDFQDYQAEEPE